MQEIQVGSKVAYSVQFLKSTGMSHSFMAHARGTVTALEKPTFKSSNPANDWVLAKVSWGNPDVPSTVDIRNLALVGLNTKLSNC